MDLFSDSDNFSESSGSEEQDDMEMFYGGHACTILSSLEETIGKIDNFLSFERAFAHGDIVCSSADPSGQMGKVVNVNMLVDLENRHGKVLKKVNSRKIKKVQSLSINDYVVLGPWLGKVNQIVDRVTVLFDDGTKSVFTTDGPDKILPIPPNMLEDTPYTYYPGQRVRVELSTILKSAKWFCGTWKQRQYEGTVFSVEAGLVYVDWLAHASVGPEKVPVPMNLHDSKNLTLLSCFCHANWQLGDWCILSNADIDEINLVKGHRHSEKVSSKIDELLIISKTKSVVDVVWQDGSRSVGLDSENVVPVNFFDAHDFWPDQFVLEKGNNFDDSQDPSCQKWGVVSFVNSKERTVRVNWRSDSINQNSSLNGEVSEETVSAYELVEHPDYSYCLGDVVFRLEKNQSTKTEVSEGINLKDDSDGEDSILLNHGYLSSIGIVMGFKAGNVEVKWATGDSTEIAPYEIFRMNKYEDSSPSHVLHGEIAPQSTQEMTEHDKHPLPHDMQDFTDSCSYSHPQAATGIFASIMGSLFGSFGYTPSSSSSSLASNSGHELASKHEDELEYLNFCTKGPRETNLKDQIEDIEEESDPMSSSESKHEEGFKRFDMVTDCSDHHFVEGAGKGFISSQMRKGWLKKVSQEWSILEKGLPETIYVRAYEDRMDLLRAVIIGAAGTPYHDGLYFFDIFLPPEYPHEPPLVHYKSGGLRANPNLYESGKVCLSLLNTWTGNETESWNPGSSTILQVLLSLQALVLNEKPYFNEAGYDKQIGRVEGEKNSLSYNENVILVSCKSMLYLLRKPPKHFEAFVEEHFRQRSKNILFACKAYIEGAPLGSAFKYEKGEHENKPGSSMGFKIMLSKLYPKLVEAFTGKSIELQPLS